MNERIKELAKQAGIATEVWHTDGEGHGYTTGNYQAEKFAELIVRECIKQAHTVGDLRGVNDDMIFGADSAALKISKYFGIEE